MTRIFFVLALCLSVFTSPLGSYARTHDLNSISSLEFDAFNYDDSFEYAIVVEGGEPSCFVPLKEASAQAKNKLRTKKYGLPVCAENDQLIKQIDIGLEIIADGGNDQVAAATHGVAAVGGCLAGFLSTGLGMTVGTAIFNRSPEKDYDPRGVVVAGFVGSGAGVALATFLSGGHNLAAVSGYASCSASLLIYYAKEK